MRLVTSLVAVLLLSLNVHAADPQAPSPAPRPGLRSEHNNWLTDGRGKLTEADVFAKLGYPDEICLADPPFVIPDVRKTWLDVNRIEVDFESGKAIRITGRFSPVSPAADINEARLRAIKSGMTVAEVERAVGFAPTEMSLEIRSPRVTLFKMSPLYLARLPARDALRNVS
jgi:hypothetical protein